MGEDVARDQQGPAEIGRQPLDARSGVDRVADCCVLEPIVVAQGAPDDVTIVDPDADPHRRQAGGAPFIAPFLHSGNHGQSAEHGFFARALRLAFDERSRHRG